MRGVARSRMREWTRRAETTARARVVRGEQRLARSTSTLSSQHDLSRHVVPAERRVASSTRRLVLKKREVKENNMTKYAYEQRHEWYLFLYKTYVLYKGVRARARRSRLKCRPHH